MRSVLFVMVLGFCCPMSANGVEFMDPHEEYKLAYEAQQKGDFAEALLHYENVIDSCDIDALARSRVVDRVRRLRPRVSVDPRKKPDPPDFPDFLSFFAQSDLPMMFFRIGNPMTYPKNIGMPRNMLISESMSEIAA